MAMSGGTAKLVAQGTPSKWPGPISLYAYYKIVSQDKDANTTTMSLGMYVTTPAGYYFGYWNDAYGSYIGSATSGSNCKSFNGACPANTMGTRWLAEDLIVTITHDNDGSKNATIYWKWGAAASWGGFSSPATGSFTVTLPKIPRASAITSASNVTLGNKCSVKWTPAAANFRYKLKFSLGNWSYTTEVIHPNKTTEYTYTGYTIPLEVASQIPKSKTGTMTVTLYTYSDSGATTQIGDAGSKTFTVTVPDTSDTKPAVTMSLAPVSTLPSAFAGLYIQGLTKVKATLSAEGKYSATIDSYTMKVDGGSYGAEDDLTSDYLTATGTRTVTGYVTDSRGHTGEKQQDITVIAYSDPKVLDASAVRCDKDGNIADSGTYLKISAKRSYSPVESDGVQKNFCKIQYRYSGGSGYTEWVTILEGSDVQSDVVTTGALLGGALSVKASYTVQIRAIDDIGRYTDTYITVPTEKVYMHRDGARNSMGLGKYVEGENLLDVAWDAHFHGEVRLGETGMTLKEYILAVIREGG